MTSWFDYFIVRNIGWIVFGCILAAIIVAIPFTLAIKNYTRKSWNWKVFIGLFVICAIFFNYIFYGLYSDSKSRVDLAYKIEHTR